MRTTPAVLLSVLALGLTACSSGKLAEAELVAPTGFGDQPVGVTYNSSWAPVGATMAVSSVRAEEKTTVTLTVQGLRPDTKYGAHVHTVKCGAKPFDTGPHYQDRKDPVTPSLDPRYANPQNEIWWDFVTDGSGNAAPKSEVVWEFREGEANSVVLHPNHTNTAHGKAGTAGDRVACLIAAF
ncbi:Cu-Zn family superoxide dismutase [Crossiella equi]|uniref:Cu-Zn family superoxide dismutase n=1 Tax=Crossiella equi TaxID=130796 RepID=A0ABS5A7J8_9PSEU|nr:superoxide dismutase family protein [Crossiella equi]MBP2472281.1 Cu-Zn family superoxide dismutase [Crossiella equi]